MRLLTSEQMHDWMIYDVVEPIGVDKTQLVELKEDKQPKRAQTVEEMKAVFKTIAGKR